MKKLIVFPTWLLTRIAIPFLPKTHPWYGRKFTLTEWAEGATRLTIEFSLIYWTLLPMIIFLIYILAKY